MSINVTVTGNPVCIKRGKMVTADFDSSRKEFEKRRLMRLEQVRQQSKDIAENVRSKFRKEKSKRLSEIEKEGEVKLKNWQARKLLELQNQYQEALSDIGLGHKQAECVEKEDELLAQQRENDEKIAKERGFEAAEKLQVEKNEKSLKQAVPIQRKKLSRDIENTRSTHMANLHKVKHAKSPFKKKKKKQRFSVDSDSENRVPKLVELESDSESSVSCNCPNTKESKKLSSKLKDSSVKKQHETIKNTFRQVPTCDKAAQTQLDTEIPVDTRISERIKRRALLNSEPDYCDIAENEILSTQPQNDKTKIDDKCICRKCGEKPLEKSDLIPESPKNLENQPKSPPKKLHKSPVKGKSSQKQKEIPVRPKITLRSSKEGPEISSSLPTKNVQHYDHPNRYSKYAPSTSHIEKIDDTNLTISPDVLSDDEFHKKMHQRDMEAHIRGQKAMEKEKIHREYRELLKKLPVLQKQERICDINSDKPQYHMSNNRLEEFERKRQNHLENAYENLFTQRKPAVVTIPRRNEAGRASPPSLNLAAWDVDFTGEEKSQKSRNQQLNALLENLKAQKNELLKEVEQLPQTNDSISKDDTDTVKSRSKRKRSRDERVTSPTSSDINEGTESKISSSKGEKSETVSTVPSPRKKVKLKSKRKVLILQNTSTQTTPKPELTEKAQLSPAFPQEEDKCKEDHAPCNCHEQSKEDLCEIVIKIKEDEKPEVIVNPPGIEKSIKVITEQKEDAEKEISKKLSPEERERIKKVSPHKSTVKRDETKDAKEKTSSVNKKIPPPDKKKHRALWHEQFSQSSSLSTTTTSYLSPPDFSRIASFSGSDKNKPRLFPAGLTVPQKPQPPSGEFSRSSNSAVSSSADSRQLDPRLLIYIKKLLNMSRASIDELAVSAASEVSTPSQSVVEMPTNNPLAQLRNVIKYFNLDPVDLRKQLSSVSNDSHIHYNTSRSVTVSSTSESERTRSQTPVSLDPGSRTDTSVSVDGTTKQLTQYADIAESCNKKISNLTAMIEKVRAEKKKILQSPPGSESDKDYSTAYLDLPQMHSGEGKDPASSSSSSVGQDELDKKLLEIDYSYAERLKALTPEELQKEKKRQEQPNNSDEELLMRLKRLLGDPKVQEEKTQPQNTDKNFVPLLLDIPKLPKLEAPSLDNNVSARRRPPPSKGLRIVQKLNGNFGTIHHELSTIIEADSQLSTRLDPTPKSSNSPKKDESVSSKSSGSVPDILTEVPHSSSKANSSDDKSEMDAMETMLQSIGMEWAIPTLRKTREALALTSSSSSGNRVNNSSTDATLLSSSSMKSNQSLGSFQDAMDKPYAAIETSTPVQLLQEGGRNPAHKRVSFIGESDISSVRDSSGKSSVKDNSDRSKDREMRFYDVNEGSLSKTG